MMKFYNIFILTPLLLLPRIGAALDSQEDRVIVLGLDSMKRATTVAIPAALYRRTLTTAFSAVNESITPALEKREAPLAAPLAWSLNSIGVGLGLSAQLGIGPLLNVTVTPQLRLIFSDSTNPVYPN